MFAEYDQRADSSHVDDPVISKDAVKELLTASTGLAKPTRKHSEIDVRTLVISLISSSVLKRPRLTLFGGSYAIFASVVKGICCIYGRRVEGLMRDCEGVSLRKIEARISLVPRPPNPPQKRRLSSTTRRRSVVSSIAPAADVGFEAMMDLDALCADLSRRSIAQPLMSPLTPRGKKSRSGSSVSHDEEAFEAPEMPVVDIDLDGPLLALPPVEPVTVDTPPASPEVSPPRRRKKATMKGFNPKVKYTSVEWASILRGENITRGERMTPADYAAQGRLDLAQVKRFLFGDPEETVSVAEAVDLDSVLDELRADEDLVYEDDVVPERQKNRPSIASSFAAASSRRQSIASDLIFDDIVDDHTAQPLLDEADELKVEIKRALSTCHAKKSTIVCLSDVSPPGTTCRRMAAHAFVQLLVLSTRNEIRFKHTSLNFTEEPSFVVGDESSSSSDYA